MRHSKSHVNDDGEIVDVPRRRGSRDFRRRGLDVDEVEEVRAETEVPEPLNKKAKTESSEMAGEETSVGEEERQESMEVEEKEEAEVASSPKKLPRKMMNFKNANIAENEQVDADAAATPNGEHCFVSYQGYNDYLKYHAAIFESTNKSFYSIRLI